MPDPIDALFQKFEEAMNIGEGVSMDYYLKYVDYSVAQAKSDINRLIREARIDECERVMKIPGSVFVGNGESEIHWQTRNRISALKAKEEQ